MTISLHTSAWGYVLFRSLCYPMWSHRLGIFDTSTWSMTFFYSSLVNIPECPRQVSMITLASHQGTLRYGNNMVGMNFKAAWDIRCISMLSIKYSFSYAIHYQTVLRLLDVQEHAKLSTSGLEQAWIIWYGCIKWWSEAHSRVLMAVYVECTFSATHSSSSSLSSTSITFL